MVTQSRSLADILFRDKDKFDVKFLKKKLEGANNGI